MATGATPRAGMVEEDEDGHAVKHHHPIAEGTGSPGATFYAFPRTGYVRSGWRVKVEVTHFGDSEVTLDSSYPKVLVWDR